MDVCRCFHHQLIQRRLKNEDVLKVCFGLYEHKTWMWWSERNTLYIVLLHKIRSGNEWRRRSRTSWNITSNRISISRSSGSEDQRTKKEKALWRRTATGTINSNGASLNVTLDRTKQQQQQHHVWLKHHKALKAGGTKLRCSGRSGLCKHLPSDKALRFHSSLSFLKCFMHFKRPHQSGANPPQ